MSNNQRYFNPETGKFDTHAKKMAGKAMDGQANEFHKLKSVTDGSKIYYHGDLVSTLNVPLEKPVGQKKNTKLRLYINFMRPCYEETKLALKGGNYSLVPNNTFPTPMKPKYLRLAS